MFRKTLMMLVRTFIKTRGKMQLDADQKLIPLEIGNI